MGMMTLTSHSQMLAFNSCVNCWKMIGRQNDFPSIMCFCSKNFLNFANRNQALLLIIFPNSFSL